MIKWLKGLSWVAILGAIGTAALMIYQSMRASNLEARADQNKKVREVMLQDKTKENIQAAAKLQEGVDKDIDKADDLKEKSRERLEALGDKDATMADIADRFNKRKRERLLDS